MPDYGRPLEFGVSVAPLSSAYSEIRATAADADRLGLDLMGIQDHPYQYRFLDTTTLLASLAASTERLRLFHDVASLPLRPAPILAKEAASIDLMSGGRFELGLGAGSFWDAIASIGGPRRSPGEALAALEEAVAVSRLVWSGERDVVYDGDYYRLEGLNTGPVPAHPIEIWFGVGGPRALALLGRVADGWLPSLGRYRLEEIDIKHGIVDESAEANGREPSAIRRLVNINGTITGGRSDGFLNGPADQWVDELTRLTIDHGFDTFILWPEEPDNQVARFADLLPEVRDAVERERA